MQQPALVIAILLLSACATDGIRRFPLGDPLWVDPDANPITGTPRTSYFGEKADGIEHMIFRPLSRLFTLPLEDEAWNVNSLDEVPNSTWFQNRIGAFAMTPEEVAAGACGDTPALDPTAGPWWVVGAKPDGDNPGFTIKGPDGWRYLLKLDGELQPPRMTAADVIGAKLYHAAGYHTPCNQIVYFAPEILRIAPGATRKDEYGDEHPLGPSDLETLLTFAWRTRDGRMRAMASRFLRGTPVGPFRYEGTRADDPNDVIPHEKRRELRAGKVFAAWINHVDSRAQNSLDLVVEEGGRRFVRHHKLDWGDALGSVWTHDGFSRRLGIGRSGYFDVDHVFVDLVTLGLYPRPWNQVVPSPETETFGYFGVAHFDPDLWRGGYPNPAFEQMTARDALWAVRILARFTDAHVRAVVATARLEDTRAATFLTDALIARRDVILRRYLGRGSPLTGFTLVRRPPASTQALCFEDLAITTGVADPAATLYKVHVHGGEYLERQLGWLHFHPDAAAPARSCVPLGIAHPRPHDLAGAAAADDHPLRYTVVEIHANQRPSLKATSGVAVHLYDLGPARGYRLVGIERMTRLPHPP